MDTLVLDIGYEIHNLLDFFSQVNLRLVSKHFAKNYHITNLHDFEFNSPQSNLLKPNLTTKSFGYTHIPPNEILRNYPHTIKLKIANVAIKDISNMPKLQMLIAFRSNITNDVIKKLPNLVVLNVTDCEHVTDINCLAKLRILYASYTYGIDDNGLKNLVNLHKLEVNGNMRVTNINHMSKLQILDARSAWRLPCGIKNDGIQKLTELIILDISYNENITDVNHMKKLKLLKLGGDCNIGPARIAELDKSVKISGFMNNKIKRRT